MGIALLSLSSMRIKTQNYKLHSPCLLLAHFRTNCCRCSTGMRRFMYLLALFCMLHFPWRQSCSMKFSRLLGSGSEVTRRFLTLTHWLITLWGLRRSFSCWFVGFGSSRFLLWVLWTWSCTGWSSLCSFSFVFWCKFWSSLGIVFACRPLWCFLKCTLCFLFLGCLQQLRIQSPFRSMRLMTDCKVWWLYQTCWKKTTGNPCTLSW